MTTQVTNDLIADGAVTGSKLAAGAVDATKIAAGGAAGTQVGSVATTSGTTVDLSTSIPAGVKRVFVALNGVSLNGSSQILLQIGAGSYTTSGYVGGAAQCGGTPNNTTATAGMQLGMTGSASITTIGHAILTNITGNTWVMSFFGTRQTDGYGLLGSSILALGGALDRVRLASLNGTDTFDAGSANIAYE